MSILRHERFQYDTATPLVVTAQVFNLTVPPGALENFDDAGYTLAFRMVRDGAADTETPKVDDATATQPSVGYLRYDWTAADVDTAGVYRAWFIAIRDVGGAVTFFPARGTPIEIVIRQVMGEAPEQEAP